MDKDGEAISNKTGKLSKGNIQNANIEFTNLKSGVYIVTAKSKSPYIKTIQANFILTELNDKITYQVSDSVNSPVVQLTVKTNDYSGDLTINYPTEVIPDNTDPKFPNDFTDSQFTVNFNSNAEYTFQFFKKDPTIIYTNENFEVEKS